MNGTIDTLTVDTQAQALILTELQHTHHQLVNLLVKIEEEARKASGFANLDTMFLRSRTDELPALAATYETFRQSAKWAGCNPVMIAMVCQTEWVRIEWAEKKETGK